MDGKNASGRKVSLLNDRPPTFTPAPRLHDHSRTSSHCSRSSRAESNSSLSHSSNSASPVFSPASPPLARLDSSSSQSTGRDSPSPMTPSYPYDAFEQSKTISPYDSYYRQNGSNYPAMPQPQDTVSQPYYHLPARHISNAHMDSAIYTSMARPILDTQFAFAPSEPTTPNSPMSTIPTPPTGPPPSGNSATTSASSSSKLIKKKYPCPHAHRHSCPDTFTTSGHAARHGKKHTGEKNITCPTCHKAFTRKDNMKQHERTHKATGRRNTDSNAKASSNVAPLSPQAARGSRRKASTSAAPASDFDPMDCDTDADPNATMPGSKAHAPRSGVAEAMTMSGLLADTMGDSRPGSSSHGSDPEDGDSPSGGLDALAMAASGLSA
ncbi:MAG: hypothetical protein LQ347_004999 [Umbilicaria vellea]|nr:MAG: hypothetical protein LQ347_004999 [Umbilicaria vellea]